MSSNERTRHRGPREAGGPDSNPEEGALDALAQQGADFAAAANEIISSALSGNSQEFLNANRQHTGQ